MKITKYLHACLVLEKDGQRLVIDPGLYSEDFVVPENVAAVIITHEHPDHLDPEKLTAIFDKNPNALLIAHQSILDKAPGHTSRAVNAGDSTTKGGFSLRFTGGEHAIIHESLANVANLGVVVDDELYYPGDSLSLPESSVRVLAIPASAPWMRIGEAMDFLAEVKPEKAFPTHDAILSARGQASADNWLNMVAQKIGASYERLPYGEPVEL